MRLLIAYGREFVNPRPYTLEGLAQAAGMSFTGVRTAYNDDEVAEVAARTGARPRRRTATPPATATRTPAPTGSRSRVEPRLLWEEGELDALREIVATAEGHPRRGAADAPGDPLRIVEPHTGLDEPSLGHMPVAPAAHVVYSPGSRRRSIRR
jgi:hypothetical protein